MPKILIVDDTEYKRLEFAELLAGPGREIMQASNLKEGLDSIQRENFDVVITDLRLDPDRNNQEGLEILKAAIEKNPDTPVIVVTQFPSRESVAKAIAMGAWDYIDLTNVLVRYQVMLPRKVEQALQVKPNVN